MNYVSFFLDVSHILRIIRANYVEGKLPVPEYDDEEGIAHYRGVLARVTTQYYGNLFEKAAYLLTTITKGHYFKNGNRRLALFTTLLFLAINKYEPKKLTWTQLATKLEELFQTTHLLKQVDLDSDIENGLYYLVTFVAGGFKDSHYHFDDLKLKAAAFFEFAFEKQE